MEERRTWRTFLIAECVGKRIQVLNQLLQRGDTEIQFWLVGS